jgi:hypothetical protein
MGRLDEEVLDHFRNEPLLLSLLRFPTIAERLSSRLASPSRVESVILRTARYLHPR